MKLKLYREDRWVGDGWNVERPKVDEPVDVTYLRAPVAFTAANDEDLLKELGDRFNPVTGQALDRGVECVVVEDDRSPVKFGKDKKGEYAQFTGKPGVGETMAVLEGKKYRLMIGDVRMVTENYVRVIAGFPEGAPPEVLTMLAKGD